MFISLATFPEMASNIVNCQLCLVEKILYCFIILFFILFNFLFFLLKLIAGLRYFGFYSQYVHIFNFGIIFIVMIFQKNINADKIAEMYEFCKTVSQKHCYVFNKF